MKTKSKNTEIKERQFEFHRIVTHELRYYGINTDFRYKNALKPN